MDDDKQRKEARAKRLEDQPAFRAAQEKLKKKQDFTDVGTTAGAFYGSVEGGAHTEALLRFNGHQGHGSAAEQANNLWDTFLGKDAQILGNDNAKNGPDRMVDGTLIQTKYCKTAKASVEAAFDPQTKLYRYLDKNGMPMQLEVSSEQYEEAVQIMRKRIAAGQVPGVKNPNEASRIVRKGYITHKQACNIAKAGTVDSLVFDAAHGIVIATSAFGISAVITFAHSLWAGKNLEDAIDDSMYVGIKMGGTAFVGTIIASQLTRTGLNAAIQQPLIGVIRALPSGMRRSMVSMMKDSALIYGRDAAGNLAKLWSSNIISSAAFVLVMSAEDISHFFSGKISGKQLFKNVIKLSAGMGGAYAGAVAGVKVGAAAGSALGPAGAIVGGIAGGMAASAISSSVLNHFIEDDAVTMVKILNERMIIQAQDYLLNEEELNLVLEDLQVQLVQSKLLEMYASKDRKKFADDLLQSIIEKITRLRAHIFLPPDSAFLEGMERILTLSQNPAALQAHMAGKKVDTLAVGRKLMGYEISKHAADKAWYAAKQMNLTNGQQEMCLTKMQSDEKRHEVKLKEQQKEMEKLQTALNALLEE
ncbi:MAG: hypothetical protein LKE33_12995 [Acidaminococcus sp.]|jgi:hypothetical protein|nr:hypothetical protein [Acidaminococcus sp.]MCI2100719.1 hypothetical protein [Acidaminococcus sp.]MCI2115040.1 hypothetical protein [Acidaminococcus sp.]MCI2117116.1 hypothetical protein [Acidaminococcus sp.]